MHEILEILNKKYNTKSQIINNVVTVSVLRYSEFKKKNIIIDTYYFVYRESLPYPIDLFHSNKNNSKFHFQGYFKEMEDVYKFIFSHSENHLRLKNNHKSERHGVLCILEK